MDSVDFNFYKTGTAKQKAWAHAIKRNIVNGQSTLTKQDYASMTKLVEEAFLKCVMIAYADQVKKGEIDAVSRRQFIEASNQAVSQLNQAIKKRTVKERRQALIDLVPDAVVIINFRHSYSTLEWVQIAYIYLMDQALKINMRTDEYRITGCRA